MNKRFRVRWSYWNSKKWKDFYPRPERFYSLQKAQDWIDYLDREENNGSYRYRVFEEKGGKVIEQ